MNKQVTINLITVIFSVISFLCFSFAEYCAVLEKKTLTEPDTAPDIKVIVSVGSVVFFHSHSHVFPFS